MNTSQFVIDRNTVAHLALERMLACVGEQVEMLNVRVTLYDIDSTDAETGRQTDVHEHVNTLSTELIADDGTWSVESVDNSHEDFLGDESLRNRSESELVLPINTADPDYNWAAAKAGWQMILNWVNEQKAIDGDLIQVTEILNEWLNEANIGDHNAKR